LYQKTLGNDEADFAIEGNKRHLFINAKHFPREMLFQKFRRVGRVNRCRGGSSVAGGSFSVKHSVILHSLGLQRPTNALNHRPTAVKHFPREMLFQKKAFRDKRC
jgi:hypothetical protein